MEYLYFCTIINCHTAGPFKINQSRSRHISHTHKYLAKTLMIIMQGYGQLPIYMFY